MQRAALLSVSDRTGLDSFAKILQQAGYHLLSTSGTTKYLSEQGIKSNPIEEYTGQREILDGRVKTLHPKIHAGLLAKRDKKDHIQELTQENILPIDIAVVNLYPFVQGLKGDSAGNPDKMIELVDIGGPTMIRAAAKNFKSVLPLIDPTDYEEVASYIIKAGNADNVALTVPLELRRKLASKVFAALAQYNLEIARYFSQVYAEGDKLVPQSENAFPLLSGQILIKSQDLRYGENPHQKGAYYRPLTETQNNWRQLQGKELSYNNFLDFDAAFRLIRAFAKSKPTAAILKHLNPCGAASADNLFEALKKAKQGDPRSHFGGVLTFNSAVDEEVALSIAEDFAEIVVAPDYSREALEIFAKKKNLRVLSVNLDAPLTPEIRSVQGGFLVQESDILISSVNEAEVVSKRKPSAVELEDLQFAWNVCAHVKSNAITIAKEGMLLASGAGQMSRIDSAELALSKCKTHNHNVENAVAASDAFFPFTDCIEQFAAQGIKAVIAPSGAKKDAEVIETADKLGLSLLFTRDRHFRH